MVIAQFQAQETTFVRLRETLRPRRTLLRALSPCLVAPEARLQVNFSRLISSHAEKKSFSQGL